MEVLGRDVNVRGDPGVSALGLPQPSTTDWGAQTTDDSLLIVLGARSPRSRCRQCWFLLRPHPWLAGGRFLPVSSHSLPSVCDSVLIPSSYKDVSHVGLGPTLTPRFSIITSLKILSPKIDTFWGPGGQG